MATFDGSSRRAVASRSRPEKRSLADSIKVVSRIKKALDWIAEDLTRANRLDEPTNKRVRG
jgi:hypothetical protein